MDLSMMQINIQAAFPMTRVEKGIEELPMRLNEDSNAGVAKHMAQRVV